MKKDLVELWTFAVGNLPGIFSLPHVKKKTAKAIKLIKEQEGFVGVNPQPPRGTLLLFKTENNAKKAKNILSAAGIACGNGIYMVHVEKRYLEGTPYADN